jgi:hypothetical protein
MNIILKNAILKANVWPFQLSEPDFILLKSTATYVTVQNS